MHKKVMTIRSIMMAKSKSAQNKTTRNNHDPAAGGLLLASR